MRAGAKKRNTAAFWLILALGVFARVFRFGAVPAGLNQDEAFAAYEAWSLLRTGLDTAGWPWPVYLTAWGSGMNALESYWMLPFLALFGLQRWVVRLPQLITALLSLPAVYGTAKRIWDEKHGLTAMLLLAVCPWHVLLSRWGLESNLAPGFVLFGLYFFLRGTEDSRFLLLSGLCYGLSLYAYAAIWPVLPFVLLLQAVYAVRRGRLRPDRFALSGALLLGLLALPLLLFLAVNRGWLEPIRTPFFSVPRLPVLRAGELSLTQSPENLKNLFSILWRQSDGLVWNSAGPFGLLYPFSLPFVLLGLGLSLYHTGAGRRSWRAEALVLFQLLGALLLGALLHVNINRINILFIPLLLFCAHGVCAAGTLWKGRLLPALLAVWLLAFGLFQAWYYTEFPARTAPSYAYGLEEAIAAAPEEGLLVFSDDVYYPTVLFYTQTDPEEFRQSVVYKNYPAAYLRAEGFGRFRFGLDAWPEDASYILSVWTDYAALADAGWRAQRYGCYVLLTR